MRLSSDKLAALLNVLRKGGSPAVAMEALDTEDEALFATYMKRARKEDAEAVDEWTQKHAGGDDEEDLLGSDDEDLLGESEPVKPSMKGHTAEEGKRPVERKADPGTIQHTGGAVVPRYRFRDEDGMYHELEIFSQHPVHGITLSKKGPPPELKTIRLRGKDVEVDLAKLRADPDGMNHGVSNSRVLDMAELQ